MCIKKEMFKILLRGVYTIEVIRSQLYTCLRKRIYSFNDDLLSATVLQALVGSEGGAVKRQNTFIPGACILVGKDSKQNNLYWIMVSALEKSEAEKRKQEEAVSERVTFEQSLGGDERMTVWLCGKTPMKCPKVLRKSCAWCNSRRDGMAGLKGWEGEQWEMRSEG